MRSSKSSSTRSILEPLATFASFQHLWTGELSCEGIRRQGLGRPCPELAPAHCFDLSYSININHVRRPLSKAVNAIDLGTGRPTNYTAYIPAFHGARPRTTFSFFNWAGWERSASTVMHQHYTQHSSPTLFTKACFTSLILLTIRTSWRAYIRRWLGWSTLLVTGQRHGGWFC